MKLGRKEFLTRQVLDLAFSEEGQRVRLLIAGIRLDWITRSPELEKRLVTYFEDYLTEDESRASVELSADPLSPVSPAVPPSLSATLWEDSDPEFDLKVNGPCESVVQRDFAARRISPTRAVAYLAPGLDDAIHNSLRWFLPRTLLRDGAFLMHAAGVIRDGRGYVFFGQSGAGKSTTAAMIRACDPCALVVGDDGVIIQIKGGVPTLLAAPLGCGYSRQAPPNIEAPLEGLFAIEQAPVHEIRELSSSEAVASLLASAMATNFSEDVDLRIDTALMFYRARCSVKRLFLKKDPGFWPLITGTTEKNTDLIPQRRTLDV